MPVVEKATKSLRHLIAGIDRGERLFIAFVSLVLIALTSIPAAVALLHARSLGLVWTGSQLFSPGDTALYLSEIAQASHGRLFLQNLFTTESSAGIVNIFWSAVGLFANAADLTPLAAYHLSRILLIPALVVVSYVIIAHFFEDKAARGLAVVLFLAGSGLGPFYGMFAQPPAEVGGRYDWPLDLWVAESNAFLSMTYSPNFIASLLLLLLSAFLLYHAYISEKVRYAVVAGAASLLLFQFHPYHVATLYAVGAAHLLFRIRSKGMERATVISYIVYVGISIPSIAYHYLVTYGDTADGAWFSAADAMLTPSLPYVLLGYGIIVPLAIVGFIAGRGERGARGFLAIWAVVQFALLYSPLMFQRRLTEGLQFPLTLLAVDALLVIAAAVRARPELRQKWVEACAVIGFGLLFFSSTTSSIVWGTEFPASFFMTVGEREAIDWLAAQQDDGTVLSSPRSGNWIVGFATRRVYGGHWQLTRHPVEKAREAEQFFAVLTDDERGQFLTEQGIAYVYDGPIEGGVDLSGTPGLVKAYENGTVTIWKVEQGE